MSNPSRDLQIFLAGFNEGFNRAISAAAQLSALAARSDAAQPSDAAPAHPTAAQPSAEAPASADHMNGATRATRAKPRVAVRRRRHTLLPSEQRILDFINSHPGCTGNEIRTACKSIAPAYSLVRRKLVRREEDPKPHDASKPWVRFYPVETPHAQA